MKLGLFLDRDGVINEERGYIYREEDFIFQSGVFAACRCAEALGYHIVVVTNQGGIGRGLYSQEQFLALTEWMVETFHRNGVLGLSTDAVYHSPYHPEASIEKWRGDSPCRKPNPGMIVQAASRFGIDVSRSVLVGDRATDIEAARRAGIGACVFMSGDGTAQTDPPCRDALHMTDMHQLQSWLETRWQGLAP